MPPHIKRTGLPRIINAFGYSLQGLRAALAEAAFRQELLLLVVSLPVVFLTPTSKLERILLIGSLLLVLIVELLNSSVESAIDRISEERHHLSKRAKDMGSAAVLLALVNAAIIWISIYFT